MYKNLKALFVGPITGVRKPKMITYIRGSYLYGVDLELIILELSVQDFRPLIPSPGQR